jgi:poly(3-hydroxybutyrate) depolymerase
MLKLLQYIVLVGAALGVTGGHAQPRADQALHPGTGEMTIEASSAAHPVPMQVFYATPDRITPDTRIVFVMHGAHRDASHYRDIWTPYAKQYGFIAVAPEFSKEQFPGVWHYQMGGVFDATGKREPPDTTAYAAIGKIFDVVRHKFRLNADTYDIFGHSAGGQFVHRMVLFWPQARIRLAIAANAGTYTVPDTSVPLPFGIGNAGLDKATLAHAFATRLVVMVGSRDTDPNHRLLNRSAGAMKEGPNRLARGKYFFNAARRAAQQAGVPFRWTFRIVEGVAHSASGMSVAASKIIGAQQ